MSYPRFLCGALVALCIVAAHTLSAALPEASASKLPRWRGFNLTEKFQVGDNKPFQEDDFKAIAAFGFNFVRLPMDYRIWIKNGDWNTIDEAAFGEIDQAIAWGRQYGIHVCINFHRAPGFTVAKPKESHDLWTDAEAQKVCAAHWAFFARRYRGIPNSQLSFNLLNEPGDLAPETYRAVVALLVNAIRREDPQRLIIADGLHWGIQPVSLLADLGIAQAARGYQPMRISHFQAGWVSSSGEQAPPVWPLPKISGIVQGAWKQDAARSIQIEGPFEVPVHLRLKIARVQPCHLVVTADGLRIASRSWEGKQSVQLDETLEADIPKGAQQVEVATPEGGWVSIRALGLKVLNGQAGQSPEVVLGLPELWQFTNAMLHFDPSNRQHPLTASANFDRDWLRNEVNPWCELSRHGVGVFVGEFGFYNKTPHEVGLAWMEDNLKVWRDAGLGWALWNFRGSFGILDSGRADVQYENSHGHKLDREMLELLQRY